MKFTNAVMIKTVILLVTLFLIGIMFSSASFASYGTVVKGDLCGIGGGETYTPPEDDNPTDNNSGSDLSISNLYISIKGQDDWKSKITKTLKPGQSFKIEGKAKVKNESDVEAEDVRVKFRVDHGKTLIPMTQSLIKKVKKT